MHIKNQIKGECLKSAVTRVLNIGITGGIGVYLLWHIPQELAAIETSCYIPGRPVVWDVYIWPKIALLLIIVLILIHRMYIESK